MLRRLTALFAARGAPAGRPDGPRAEDPSFAAAALLVEAAMMDQDFCERELEVVRRRLGARFRLPPPAVEALIAAARREVAASAQLHPYARAVREHLGPEERIELIEMLWEVAYADGVLDEFEASLLRRVAGLIHVSDRDSALARRRVLRRRERAGERSGREGEHE